MFVSSFSSKMILYKRFVYFLIEAPADRNNTAIRKYTFRSSNPDNFLDIHCVTSCIARTIPDFSCISEVTP